MIHQDKHMGLDAGNNLEYGSVEHFSQLYDKYSSAIFGLAKQWHHNEEYAQSLLQQVFEKAWESRLSYNGEKQRVFTWLYQITFDTYKLQQEDSNLSKMRNDPDQ